MYRKGGKWSGLEQDPIISGNNDNKHYYYRQCMHSVQKITYILKNK